MVNFFLQRYIRYQVPPHIMMQWRSKSLHTCVLQLASGGSHAQRPHRGLCSFLHAVVPSHRKSFFSYSRVEPPVNRWFDFSTYCRLITFLLSFSKVNFNKNMIKRRVKDDKKKIPIFRQLQKSKNPRFLTKKKRHPPLRTPPYTKLNLLVLTS